MSGLERFYPHICVPTSGFCRTKFAVCLVSLTATTLHEKVAPETTQQGAMVRIAESSVVSQNREQLVVDSLESGCTHVCFIDDDMTFPPDALFRLARHRLPIVGCNYPMRHKGETFTAMDFQDRWIPIKEESTGLQEVKLMGFGFCLIERQVFEAMDHPWFGIYWNPRLNKYTTEDGPFLEAARQRGFRSYIDHDLSKDLGHVGIFEYNWRDPV